MKAGKLLEKLSGIEKQYTELQQRIASINPSLDSNSYSKLAKEIAKLEPIVKNYEELKKLYKKLEDTESLLEDPSVEEELKELAKEEIKGLKEEIEKMEEMIQDLLIGEDEYEDRNVVMEIHAAAGGEESALFVADLLRMYLKYAEKKRWKVEIVDYTETGLGGYKEVVLLISGKDVYKYLKYESGVHRVQRVPITEASGRIHTSTATVAVLPEAKDVEIDINPKDIKIETFRASGHGGQYVNKTESAVRITHIPTGIVVSCQDERSQLQNRAKALRILKTKLLELERQKMHEERTKEKRSQIGTGERAEKIRTYNFPQNRVTDHRINLTIYNLQEVLEGNLDPFINELMLMEKRKKLEEIL